MTPAAKPTTGAAQPSTLTVDSQLMQDYLQSAGILVNSAASPPVASFQNNDGDSEAVVIDVNGNLQHVCREPLSDSGWNMYGLGAGFRAIAPVDAATLWAIGLLTAPSGKITASLDTISQRNSAPSRIIRLSSAGPY